MEKLFDSKKAILSFKAVGDNKPRKQTLANLIEDASDESILDLSDVFNNLAPTDEPLEKLAIVDTHHYDI
ncbi:MULTISPECIES: hypothetical protein [Enterococcaceae]|uniref:hypothetical protein n=1 Tax=Enterococcaceae TaxID=81852 RepID=UPI000E4DD2C7|nr:MULTISPECIES: hypothetical protein [Enterococcaceae]MCI0130546.1 hypothetical protein [Vagococcus sp. CY53-2]RGI32256.1 hypothetical protein DXC12_02855 [Melissococcus sp. OM08-11BH]UNM89975.1 hypothetical protein MN187_02465 [Vagococcus sp. CY52-2]